MSEATIAARADAARASAIDPSTVVGWAIDADPRNDPTYPIRDRSKDDGLSINWERPQQQQSDVEILQSVEYRHFPAVFGTSVPPRWISGMIRRAAFRWSESNWLHWLLLIGADRINVVEGVVQDLGRGKVPNIPAELGAKAEWKHNKTGLVKKIAIAGVIGGALFALTRSSHRQDRDRPQQD